MRRFSSWPDMTYTWIPERPEVLTEEKQNMEVFVTDLSLRSRRLHLPTDATVQDLVQLFSIEQGIPTAEFYVKSNGYLCGEDESLQMGVLYRLEPRLCGGKGGFGSMLRALGAQIEKTTNREACRDLSGRRLRDVNHEKEMADWLKQQAEREAEKEQRRMERLQRKLAEPKHNFTDREYEQQCHDLAERLEDSVLKGMQAASSSDVKVEEGPSRKRPSSSKAPVYKKMKCFWSGTPGLEEMSSEEDSDASEEENLPSTSSSSQTFPGAQSKKDATEAQSSDAKTATEVTLNVAHTEAGPKAPPTGDQTRENLEALPTNVQTEVVPEPLPTDAQPEAMPEPPPTDAQPEPPPTDAQPEATPEPPPTDAQPEAMPEPPPTDAQPEVLPEPLPTDTQPKAVPDAPPTDTQPKAVPEAPPTDTQPKAVPEAPPTDTQPEALPTEVQTMPVPEPCEDRICENPRQVPSVPTPETSCTSQSADTETTDVGQLDLLKYGSAAELEALGLDELKTALTALGMKCGGTVQERAARLFSVRGLPRDKINAALLAKPAKGKRK